MKTTLCILLLALCPLSSHALDLPVKTPPQAPQAVAEVTLTGVLERRVSIGGETTGWALRCDKDRIVELTFTLEALSHVREGVWVACTGKFETRHYPQRGDVRIFVVRELHEVVT